MQSYEQQTFTIFISLKTLISSCALLVLLSFHSSVASKCIDTVGWRDSFRNANCTDYAVRGWCVNKTLSLEMQLNLPEQMNYPKLHCCECGKIAQLVLSSTARWSQNAVTVAGLSSGLAGVSPSQLKGNMGISMAEDDTLYIADTVNNRIAVIRPGSTTATALFGYGSTTDKSSNLQGPTDVFVTRAFIYVMDSGKNRVQKFSKNGTNPVTVAGITGIDDETMGLTVIPGGKSLFIDNYGELYVSDDHIQRVIRFPENSLSGVQGLSIAGNGALGNGLGMLCAPAGLFVDEFEMVYIADYCNNQIQKWRRNSNMGLIVAGNGRSGNSSNQLALPTSVVVDSKGYMYISEAKNARITRWAPNGKSGECIVACTGTSGIRSDQLSMPFDLAFDSNGSLYVSDTGNNRVQKFQILESIDSTVETSSTTISTASTVQQASMTTTTTTTTIILQLISTTTPISIEITTEALMTTSSIPVTTSTSTTGSLTTSIAMVAALWQIIIRY